MSILFSNNAASTLSSGIGSGATSLVVASAANFPVISGSDYFYLTLSDAGETVWEVVKVTATSGTTFTITRAQDGTTALAWGTGANVQGRLNAQSLRDVMGDMLSSLLNTEASVTGAATATIGTMHVCSGTTTDYALTLPAASGNTGKFVGVRMAPGLTKLVTVTGNGAELIDGSNTRIMWANEVAILHCNGTGWTKIGGKTIPMTSSLGIAGALSFSNSTWAMFNFYSSVFNHAPAAFQVPASAKFVALRPGDYVVSIETTTSNGNGSTVNTLNISFNKNGVSSYSTGAYCPSSQYDMVCFEKIMPMAAGDYIQPYGFYSAGSYASSVLYNDSASHTNNVFEIREVPTW